MSRLSRLLVTGLVAALALVPAAVPAHAADPVAAQKSAAWLSQPERMEVALEYGSAAADFLIAFAAAQDPATVDEVEAILEALQTTGPDYAIGDGPAAAKLAIALDAVGEDPRTFLSIDLIDIVEADAADGQFGSWPGPFVTGLGAAALSRAGVLVPDSMIAALLTFAAPSGAFGWGAGGDGADVDNTSMAILALLTTNDTAAVAAREAAIDWAIDQQSADGSWPGYNVINATSVMGSVLETAGVDQALALSWLVGQQQPSGAFLDGQNENLMATVQGILLLGGVSYLDVTWDVPNIITPTSTPSAPVSSSAPVTTPADLGTTESAAPSTTATPSAEASTAAPYESESTSESQPESTTSGTADKLPQTGTETPLGVIVGGLLAVAAGAGLLLAGHRRTRSPR